MADLGAEPSMEEILSSIKRIIAEEGDAPSAEPPHYGDDEGVLELNEPAPAAPPASLQAQPAPVRLPPAAAATPPREEAPHATSEAPILSGQAADATRGSLEALSRLVIKPEAAGSNTLEGLVQDMLRPMLRDWLDANLPAMVEAMVAREIQRITEQR
jgi:uncharacterized protein